MTKQSDIEEWFNKTFWPSYPRELCRMGKLGSKGKAMQSMLKINPDADERARILANMKAMVRYDLEYQRKTGEKPTYWRHCVTWLNQRGYDDEIGSHADIEKEKAVRELPKCSTDGCTETVHGLRFSLCPSCIHKLNKPHYDQLKDNLHSMGLRKSKDETMLQFNNRCRAKYRELVASGQLTKKIP